MTPYLDGIKHLIHELLGIEYEKSAPVLKKAGEGIPGDIQCSLTIAAGMQRSRFNICFDSDFVLFAKDELEKKNPGQWAELDTETAAKNLVLAVYNHAEKKISEIMGGQPTRVSTLYVIEPKSKDDQETLLKSTGVMIKNSTSRGNIYTAAIKRQKTQTV